MRRKPGILLPIELSFLTAGLELRLQGASEFHGFMIAKEIKERNEAKRFVTQGTLYRALNRMANAGLLASRWEDPEISEREGRPRRRLYEVTVAGEQALAKANQTPAARSMDLETKRAERWREPIHQSRRVLDDVVGRTLHAGLA